MSMLLKHFKDSKSSTLILHVNVFFIYPKFIDQKAEEIFSEGGFHENGNFHLKKFRVETILRQDDDLK